MNSGKEYCQWFEDSVSAPEEPADVCRFCCILPATRSAAIIPPSNWKKLLVSTGTLTPIHTSKDQEHSRETHSKIPCLASIFRQVHYTVGLGHSLSLISAKLPNVSTSSAVCPPKACQAQTWTPDTRQRNAMQRHSQSAAHPQRWPPKVVECFASITSLSSIHYLSLTALHKLSLYSKRTNFGPFRVTTLITTRVNHHDRKRKHWKMPILREILN